jgi:hypothetical protein
MEELSNCPFLVDSSVATTARVQVTTTTGKYRELKRSFQLEVQVGTCHSAISVTVTVRFKYSGIPKKRVQTYENPGSRSRPGALGKPARHLWMMCQWSSDGSSAV